MKKIVIISGIDKKFFSNFFKNKKFIFFDHKKVTEKDVIKKIKKKNTLLISIASGFILSRQIIHKIKKFNLINIHPGSPLYPGRDSNHHACFNNETYFGATIHYINHKIDNGQIIDTSLLKVPHNSNHFQYGKIGIKCSKNLFKKYFTKIFTAQNFLEIKNKDKKWGKKIYKRKDLIEKFKIKKNIKKRDFINYFKSFYTGNIKSLYISIHGKKFYLIDEL